MTNILLKFRIRNVTFSNLYRTSLEKICFYKCFVTWMKLLHLLCQYFQNCFLGNKLLLYTFFYQNWIRHAIHLTVKLDHASICNNAADFTLCSRSSRSLQTNVNSCNKANVDTINNWWYNYFLARKSHFIPFFF